MFQLTAPQATLIGAVLVLIGGLVGRGFAFVLKRRMTGAPKHEQAAYFNSVADLAGKLRAHGMTIEDVQDLEALMRNPAIAASPAANEAVEAMVEDADEPQAFQSNAAMRARASAAFEVAEAKLMQALMDLRLLIDIEENVALNAVQSAWAEYRKELTLFASLEFGSGTHAPLAGTLARLAETERRAAEVRAQVKERGTRHA